jgi:hypothetical protein
MSKDTQARDALIQRIGRAKYEELERRASDDWDGVSVDIEPIPLWAAVLCALVLVGIVVAVVWAVFFGGRS